MTGVTVAKPLETGPPSLDSWFFLDPGAGAPVQCGSPGRIRCAFDDSANCKWGTYGISNQKFQKISGARLAMANLVNTGLVVGLQFSTVNFTELRGQLDVAHSQERSPREARLYVDWRRV